MRDERSRRGAAVEGLHHGRFHFDKPVRFELPPQRRDDLRPRQENLLRFRIGDQVQIALAVADLHVFESMPLFRHVEQRFRQERQFLGVHAQLTRARAEQVAVDAHDIARFEHLEQRVFVLGNRVLADIRLEPLAGLQQVHESRLAHQADGRDAAGDAHLRLIGELFGGLRAVFGKNPRDGVREIESLPVGPKSERFNFADPPQALCQEIIFEGHCEFVVSGSWFARTGLDTRIFSLSSHDRVVTIAWRRPISSWRKESRMRLCFRTA